MNFEENEGLSQEERREKVLKYWMKKRTHAYNLKKIKYVKRKKVADKKLRINGKFVSK